MQQQQDFQQQRPPDNLMGVRNLEEKYTNLARRLQLVEQNGLAAGRKSAAEFRDINGEISEMKKQLEEIRERIQEIIKELQTLSKREEVDVLKKYLNLWEPVNFVTQNDVERVVERVLDARDNSKK